MTLENVLEDNLNLKVFFKLIMKWNWLSMRTMSGPLTMNRVFHDTWKRTGSEIAKNLQCIPKDLENLTSIVSKALNRFAIETESSPGIITAIKCPIWDWASSDNLEIVKYELPCGDIICGAFIGGLVKGINPEYEVDVESRTEAILKKKEPEPCKFIIKNAATSLTIEEGTCKYMFRSGHCAKFQFCPYNIGLTGMPPDIVKKYSDCRYYEPSMNKISIVYRERYLPEGNEPVRDSVLRTKSQHRPHI